MKQYIIAVLLLAPVTLQAQGIMDKLKKKVRDKAIERAEHKTDKAIDKGLDKTEEAAKNATRGRSAEKKDSTALGGGTVAAGNTPASTPAATPATSTTAAPAASPDLQIVSRFDFVPGEQLVYTENFAQEAMGELPAGWNTTGNGEVVTLNNFPGKWLRLFQRSFYLTGNEKEFGDNYTVEFDVILQLKNTGYFYPYFEFGFIGTGGEPAAGNEFLRNYRKYASLEATFYPADAGRSKLDIRTFKTGREYYNGNEQTVAALSDYFGKPLHIAVQVQKERLRIWANQDKIFDAPRAIAPGSLMNQLFFEVHTSNYKEDQYGMFVSNLKVARGVPDTRRKLVEEGRFSTTGILFDVNADIIRPESFGVLKDIANVLKENPSVAIKIIGHTDTDGDDKLNLILSQKRAAAVARALQESFGIASGRMQTEGRGETVPAGDNKTKEGKALNRRVEFIKL